MDYAKRLAALSPKQRELLELKLKKKGGQAGQPEPGLAQPQRPRADMEFSLFYFSDAGSQSTQEQYRLLFEGARFADQHGFAAVWLPERHFQEFGGLYPNPSVVGAALAAMTERIAIRAGSVVLPLHHPVRVAEDWAVLDNLSNGRIGISFASGWHVHDFVLSTAAHEDRKAVMFDGIQKVRRLWAGESVSFADVTGREFPISISPRPVQATLPTWVTTSGNLETWIKAGEIGAHVLAALIGHTLEELAEKIGAYRAALASHGHDPQAGRVTVMLHTFIAEDVDLVRLKVAEPLSAYLRTFIKQHESLMSAQDIQPELPMGDVEQTKDAVVAFAFERYLNTESLLGTPDKCLRAVERLQNIGVDEVACLIDFGVDHESVMESLRHLAQVRTRYVSPAQP